jgi:hypothetical protein
LFFRAARNFNFCERVFPQIGGAFANFVKIRTARFIGNILPRFFGADKRNADFYFDDLICIRVKSRKRARRCLFARDGRRVRVNFLVAPRSRRCKCAGKLDRKMQRVAARIPAADKISRAFDAVRRDDARLRRNRSLPASRTAARKNYRTRVKNNLRVFCLITRFG